MHDEFDIESVKLNLSQERPAFVAKVIRELVKDGWLIHEDSKKVYQWNRSRGEFPPKRWLDNIIFGSLVKSSPEKERPREKLIERGAENLSNSELLAILIRSGRPGESAVTAGEKLAKEFEGKLSDLALAGRGQLKLISPALEKTAYCQIMAGIELGRRIVAEAATRSPVKICGSDDAIVFCQHRFARLARDARQEEFHIVTLDTKNQVIDTHRITVGTIDASLIHPREVFRAALKDAASSIILVHNHPSGDPTPSREDHAVTERLTESGKTLGIHVLDHIVLGNPTSISIRAEA